MAPPTIHNKMPVLLIVIPPYTCTYIFTLEICIQWAYVSRRVSRQSCTKHTHTHTHTHTHKHVTSFREDALLMWDCFLSPSFSLLCRFCPVLWTWVDMFKRSTRTLKVHSWVPKRRIITHASLMSRRCVRGGTTPAFWQAGPIRSPARAGWHHTAWGDKCTIQKSNH